MHRDEKLELVRKYLYPSATADYWMRIMSRHITPESLCLEIGSGSGDGKQNQLYPDAKGVIGIDLDPRVIDNPHLDEAYEMSAYDITGAFGGRKFDCIYSHMVAEHIDDGHKFVQTQLEVLNDGGVLFHSTVSKHYWTSLINDYVPESAKNWLIGKLGSGRKSDDIFPAHYQLNSTSQIRTIAQTLGVDYEVHRMDQPPGYLRRSFILMLVYSLIHKPLQMLIPAIRPTFIFVIRKKPA